MIREIVIEGSKQEIADQITRMTDHVVRATLLVEAAAQHEGEKNTAVHPTLPSNGSTQEDAWTKELRQWAAGHKPVNTAVDDSRESIYAQRLE